MNTKETTEGRRENLTRQVRAEQVRLLYDGIPGSLLGTVVNAVILALIEAPVVHRNSLILWSAALFLITALRLIVTLRFRKVNPSFQDIPRWEFLFLLGSTGAAIIWGSASFFLFSPDDLPRQAFLALILGGVCAGGISSLSFRARAVFPFLALILLPLALKFSMEESFIARSMSFMTVFFLLVLSYNSLRILRTNQQNIYLRLQSNERETMLKKSEERYRKARDQAQQASEAKSRFLSRMSHELRTPLNAILGFTQILELEAKDESMRRDLRHILKAGAHLLELINEVLDLGRIESGAMKLSLREIEAKSLVEECLRFIAPQAQKSGIRIRNEVETGPNAPILADPLRARQALINLLSNAVKYNREGGEISIEVITDDPGKTRLLVHDTGPGLTPDQIERLFRPFERLNADRLKKDGAGIGLAITKGIIELMGGSIGVKSEPGSGASFWLEFKTPTSEIP